MSFAQLPPLSSRKGSERDLNYMGIAQNGSKDKKTLSFSPTEDDYAELEQIKTGFSALYLKFTELIADNESAPDIKQTMNPILEKTKKSFSQFYNQASIYYSNFQSLQKTAKGNQVISSSSCKLPMQQFSRDWGSLIKQIDKYSDSHPIPHSYEIETKFKGLSLALDTVLQSNERRRYPSLTLNKCVYNIRGLNKSLSSNITEFFMQSTYSNFSSDLLNSFTNDIRSYKSVLDEAFANEFVQSGILLCDLARIKANIFSDCKEIVACLKSAFSFPERMKEIQSLKNEISVILKSSFWKLSIPFAVIKPQIIEPPVKDSPSICSKLELEEPSESMEIDEPEITIPLRVVSSILSGVSCVSNGLFKNDGDIEKDGEALIQFVGSLMSQLSFYEIEKEKLKKEMVIMQSSFEEQCIIFEKSIDVLNSQKSVLEKEIEKQNLTNKSLQNQLSNYHGELLKNNDELEVLTNRGDPGPLRQSLIKLQKEYSSEDFEFKNDSDLIAHHEKLFAYYVTKECDQCKATKGRDEVLLRQLSELSGEQSLEIQKHIEMISLKINELEDANYKNEQELLTIKEHIIEFSTPILSTTRFTHGKLTSMNYDSILDLVSKRFLTLKGQTISHEEMQMTFENFCINEEQSYILELINILKEDPNIPINSTTYEEKLNELHIIRSNMISKINSKIIQYEESTTLMSSSIAGLNERLNGIGREILGKMHIVVDQQSENLIEVVFKEISDIQAPFIIRIDELSKRIIEFENQMHFISTRLNAINPTQASFSNEMKFYQIQEQFSLIHDIIDNQKTQIRDLSGKYLQYTDVLSQIHHALCELCNKKTKKNISELSDNEIISDLLSFTDYVSILNHSGEFLRSSNISSILDPLFPNQHSTHSDYIIRSIESIRDTIIDIKKVLNSFGGVTTIIDNLPNLIPTNGTKINSQSNYIKGQLTIIKRALEHMHGQSMLNPIILAFLKIIMLFDTTIN